MVKDDKLEINFGKVNSLKINTAEILSSDASISRYLANYKPELQLYGKTPLEEIEVNHWISFAIGPLTCSKQFEKSLQYLDYSLSSFSYLVGHQLTIADFAVWGALFCKFGN